jgi:hypothetical protein
MDLERTITYLKKISSGFPAFLLTGIGMRQMGRDARSYNFFRSWC